MALLAATAIPGDAAQALLRAAVTAAGAGLAWLISMSPALFSRDRPETTTITAALAGIADLVDCIGKGDEAAARHTAVNGVRRARLAMEQAGRTEQHRLTRIVETTEGLLEAALRSTVEETSPRHPALAVAIRTEIPLIAAASDPVTVPNQPLQPPSTDPLARAVEDLHSAVIGGPTQLIANTSGPVTQPTRTSSPGYEPLPAGIPSSFPPPPASVSPSAPGSGLAWHSASPTPSGSD